MPAGDVYAGVSGRRARLPVLGVESREQLDEALRSPSIAP